MRLLIFVLCGLAAVPAGAQTQLEVNEAEAEKFQIVDKALNATYGRLMAEVSPKGRSALREAQRAWVHFRDLECAFQTAGSIDGSIHPAEVSICLARVTRQRLEDLKSQLHCYEVGCPDQ